ncbi:hypothetical protein FQZ97_1190670 [compost metagenome]
MPSLTAVRASVTPSMPAMAKSSTLRPADLIASIAPSAISSFWPMTPLIWPEWAVSQFSIRVWASARDQLAVCCSRTLTSGHSASAFLLPSRREICADWPIGPSMITTLPLQPILSRTVLASM